MQKKENGFSFNRVAVALGALLICCSLFYWSNNVYAYTDATVCVFMEKDIDQSGINYVQEQIEKLDDVKDVKYVSAEQAWEDFKEEYFTGQSENLAEEFEGNPLGDSENFQMRMRKDADVEQLQKQIEKINGVRSVNIK